MIWSAFKDWVYKSYVEHPVYTIMFGTICFIAGGFIL